MVRGIYAAASGALVAQSQADNVANNLANVNSSGFKQTLLQIESAPSLDIYRIQTDPGQTSGSATPGVSVAAPVGPLGTGSQVYDTPEDFAFLSAVALILGAAVSWYAACEGGREREIGGPSWLWRTRTVRP